MSDHHEQTVTVPFTREDSDRLVRIEEAVKAIPDLVKRVDAVERKQNVLRGALGVIVFIFASVIGIFHRSI